MSYKPVTKAITPVEYGGLQKAYDFFKEHLLKERWLPDVFITYQRKSRMYGYFGPDRFTTRGEQSGRHEIALNPDGFIGRSDEFVLSVLVHEMVHLWQHLFTKEPPRRAYHDKEWAAKMKSLGLQPSSTGEPGGKETGQHMSHYVIEGGAFDLLYKKLAATGWKLNLESALKSAEHEGKKKSPTSKNKFTCPQCGLSAWGGQNLEGKLGCICCGKVMVIAT